jgi:lipoprotein Spr
LKLRVFVLFLILIAASCRTAKPVSDNQEKSKGSPEKTHNHASEINKNFQKLVNDWLGSPYKYGGCTKEGTDCSGMVYTFYKEVYQIELPRSSEEIYKKARKIDENQVKPGDLVFFAIKNKQVSHVGMYLSERKFIHSSTSKGVIVSSLNELYYKERFIGFGAYR